MPEHAAKIRVVDSLSEEEVDSFVKLLENCWWCKGREAPRLKRAIQLSSVNIGLLEGERLIGGARIVTDFIFKVHPAQ